MEAIMFCKIKSTVFLTYKAHHVIFVAFCLLAPDSFVTPSKATSPTTMENPCGRDLTAKGFQSYLPLKDEIRVTLGASRNLFRICQKAMDMYASKNMLTAAEIRWLDLSISNILGLPTRHEMHSYFPELVPQLRQDYHDISVFLVYLQHTQIQQLAYEGDLLKTELNNVKQALFSLLCSVDTLLRQQGERPIKFVDASVIPSDLKELWHSKHRYYRDYLLLKDTRLYIESLSFHYEEEILAHAQNETEMNR